MKPPENGRMIYFLPPKAQQNNQKIVSSIDKMNFIFISSTCSEVP